MCGRYALYRPQDKIAAELGIDRFACTWTPRYNIAPTQPVLAVIRDGTARRAGLLRWGLVPSWADDPSIGSRMINARVETAARKPAYREAFRRRRCLIPADGFFEWRKEGEGKQPYWIHPGDHGLLTFAGLWERWDEAAGAEPLYTCTILTRDAGDQLACYHPRMPVVLEADARDRWLDPEAMPEGLREVLGLARTEGFEVDQVSTEVNRVENDHPGVVG